MFEKRPSNLTLSDIAITTKDNPYSPFDEFEKWLQYDVTHGYNSCGLFAYANDNCDALPEKMNLDSLEENIDSLIKADPLKVYVKVYRTSNK